MAPKVVLTLTQESTFTFEEAIRKIISIGGVSDTIACMTGGIAEAFYKEISEEILANAKKVIPITSWRIWEEF